MKLDAAFASCVLGLLVGCGDKKPDKSTVVDSPNEKVADPFPRPARYIPDEVHSDFQEEGITKFFLGEWTGGKESPESFLRYGSDGSCEFRFQDFHYSGAIRYEPCKMTTTFESNGKKYIVMISPITKDNLGSERLDGIAEVFIGYDPEHRVRERALDMIIYKTDGEQAAP